MSLTERLKRENEPKSTRLAGKLFQIYNKIYNTFSKKVHLLILQPNWLHCGTQ